MLSIGKGEIIVLSDYVELGQTFSNFRAECPLQLSLN